MNRTVVAVGAILAGLAVALGAFGAHGLKEHFADGGEAWWQTGHHYMIIHAIAMILAGRGSTRKSVPWLFGAGIFFFSGSLFVMSLTGMRWLGAITPIGGVCFLTGWALFAIDSFKKPEAPIQ